MKLWTRNYEIMNAYLWNYERVIMKLWTRNYEIMSTYLWNYERIIMKLLTVPLLIREQTFEHSVQVKI